MAYLENKHVFYILLIVFIIIIASGTIVALNKPVENQNNQVQQTTLNAASGGFNVLSMSYIDMSSQSPYLQGQKVWAVSVVGGGILGQSALVRITASGAPVSGKEKPLHDFSIEIKDIQQDCEYPIRVSSNPAVQNFEIRTWSQLGAYCTMNEAIAQTGNCPGQWMILSNGQPQAIRTGTVGVYSWCKQVCGINRAAYVGDIANPNIHTQIKTGLYGGKDGQTYETTIDNFNNVFEPIGTESNPIGAVVWQSGGVTGLSCENQNLYKALYITEGVTQWRVVDANVYDTYKNKFDQLLDTCVCDFDFTTCNAPCVNAAAIETMTNNLNTYSNSVMNNNPGFGTIYQTTSLNDAVIKQSSGGTGLFNNPILTYYIKADWIGVYTPSPKAQIISTNSACFKTGESNANIKITVKNVGDEYGSFSVSATCPSPFNTLNGPIIWLAANQQTDVYLTLTGGAVDSKTVKQCTIKVEGVFGTVTASQDVCIDPRITCQANTKYCSGNQLWTCNEFGTAVEKISDCSDGCVADEFGAKCEDPNICNKNEICESNRRENTNNCRDCKVDYCSSCTSWLMSLFKDSSDRCYPKKVFEEDCVWYNVGCHFHNALVPNWNQKQFCPVIISMVGLIILMVGVLIVLILKKKGIIGKSSGGGYKPKSSSFAGIGWRGK